MFHFIYKFASSSSICDATFRTACDKKREFRVSTATCSDKLSKRCSPLSSTNNEVNNSFLAPIVDPWSRSIPTCKIRLPDWIESPSWKHRPDDFSLKYFKDLVGSKCRYYCRNILEATMNLCIGILLPECTSLCCFCLLIKISTCKPIYAKCRAWFSVFCPVLMFSGRQAKKYIKLLFSVSQQFISLFCCFYASSPENI